MANFKIGDVVRVLGKPETLRTIVDVPLEYATRMWATDPGRVWLDNGGWVYANVLELVDDELPPAPGSVQYFNSTRDSSNDQRLVLEHHDKLQRHLALRVIPRKGSTRAAESIGINLDADAALQLCHDLRRMAMEIRRKERNG